MMLNRPVQLLNEIYRKNPEIATIFEDIRESLESIEDFENKLLKLKLDMNLAQSVHEVSFS